MSQYLPYGGFKWLNQIEIAKFDVNSIECNSIEQNSSIGYILEVDLEYSDELHELHNNYSLAPEKLKINHVVKLLQQYCKSLWNKNW